MRHSSKAALAAAALALASCSAGVAAPEAEKPSLGLFTSLPIYWQENPDFASMLSEAGEPGWVRLALEERYRLDPLDTLDAQALSAVEFLVLAQPRALSAAENVALDEWVRAGGKLLLFADPMLTFHSRFPIGDPRRPQDVVLLSPILRRWGLKLTFDDEQEAGERLVDLGGVDVPVNLGGRFRKAEGKGNCSLDGSSLLASCTIGEGSVLLMADAAVLEEHSGHDHAQEGGNHAEDGDMRNQALDMLLDAAFNEG